MTDAMFSAEEATAIEEGARTIVRELAPTCLLVDDGLELVHRYGDTSAFFELPPGVGAVNLAKVLEPSLAALLAVAVAESLREGREVSHSQRATVPAGADWTRDVPRITVRARPLPLSPRERRFVLVVLERSSAPVAPPLEGASLEGRLLELTTDLDNLFRRTSVGALFLDEHLTVRRFTPAATGPTTLTAKDLGKPLDVASLRVDGAVFMADVRDVRRHGTPIERDVAAVDGRHYLLRSSPYVAADGAYRGVVATFVDATASHGALTRLQRILDSLPEHIGVLDENGSIVMCNRAWNRFGIENGNATATGVGFNYLEICRATQGSDRAQALALADRLEALLARRTPPFSYIYRCDSPTRERWFLMYAAPLAGGVGGAVVSHVDVSDRIATS